MGRPGAYLSGRYSAISASVQSNNRQSVSNVLVETDSPAFILRMVELLMPPLTCSVYVVAPRCSIVLQSG